MSQYSVLYFNLQSSEGILDRAHRMLLILLLHTVVTTALLTIPLALDTRNLSLSTPLVQEHTHLRPDLPASKERRSYRLTPCPQEQSTGRVSKSLAPLADFI